MKKIIILATALSLLSCEKEIKNTTKKEDCGCNRVFKVDQGGYKIVNNGNGSGSVYHTYNIYTVNDCTKFNDTKIFTEYENSKIPIVGECYNK